MSEIVISESVFFAVHFGVNWPVPIDFYNDVFYIGSRGLSAVASLYGTKQLLLKVRMCHCPREEPTL